MNKFVKVKEKLEFLLPFANRFAEKLRLLHETPQLDQLQEISYSLNEFVESDVRIKDFPKEMIFDYRFLTFIENMDNLKEIRNMIVHRSKTLTIEEHKSLLVALYENGTNIEWRIAKAIEILEQEYI